jgi:alpha-galactosidase
MPGGASRALRMIPAMVEVAKDVLDLCPGALFFNYGNPMTPVCRAVRKATGAEMVGLCHGVKGVARYLAEVLGVSERDFAYTAVGLNHLTWFIEARVRGEDALPRLREIARERVARAAQKGPQDADVAALNPFSFHLLLLFGAYPAVNDRHVVEFFPELLPGGRYYGKTLGVDCFSVEATIAAGDRTYQEMQRDATSPEPLGQEYFERIGGEHEQVIEIIDSIRRDLGRVYSANLPNRGQVPNLPPEAVLESPAIADGGGMKAIAQRPLPSGIAGTIAQRLAWVETVVEAALEGSRQKFVQALVLDGSVPSLETAEKLADALLAAQANYLPQFAR